MRCILDSPPRAPRGRPAPARRWPLALLGFAGCAVTFAPQPCQLDADCGSDLVCARRDQAPICVPPQDDPLVIGMSAPISGTAQALGIGMKLGVDLAFAEQNAAGGIRGRRVELAFRDDAYVPELAEAAARALVDARPVAAPPRCPTTAAPPISGQPPIATTALDRGPGAVLAFLGNVGTPTMVRAAPVAIETGTIFFGAFTGASTLLRDDRAGACRSFIFNVRASYAQEARATMELFRKRGVPDHRHLVSFDQDDSFGQAGYDSLVQAYRDVVGPFPGGTSPVTPIARFRYARNDDASVPAQVAAVAAYLASSSVLATGGTELHHVGIMMTDTYGPAAAFIRGLRDWQYANDTQQQTLGKATRLRLYFSNLSFVGPDALARALVDAGSVMTPSGLRPYTESVVVSQVVPNFQSDASEAVTTYNRLIAAGGYTPGFTSLEGYLTARVFLAGLAGHRGPFLPRDLVGTFERLPPGNLGLGATAGFTADDHQYTNSVWGTTVKSDGAFANLYFWAAGQPIQFFE